jgi:hypothetical protein
VSEPVDLTGCIDLHIHAAPDVRPRLLDDIEVARQAAECGMRAILLKSHVTSTVDRAYLTGRVVPGIQVFGGLALNHAVGGINPYAAEVALQMGAAQIWMPTISASTQRHDPVLPGLEIMSNGAISRSVREVLELVAAHDVILGTGHLSVEEISALVPVARAAGVRKILITHPEHPPVEMPVDHQRELRQRYDVMFERCFISTPLAGGDVPYDRLADIIRQVGVESTVISTDLGQAGNPAPVDGFAAYVEQLSREGLREKEIRRMASENPAALLGIA